jgi:hypothetical protein
MAREQSADVPGARVIRRDQSGGHVRTLPTQCFRQMTPAADASFDPFAQNVTADRHAAPDLHPTGYLQWIAARANSRLSVARQAGKASIPLDAKGGKRGT